MTVVLQTSGLGKQFTFHLQGGTTLPVLSGVDLTLQRGECVALHGPSGAGKSTLMRSIYANYRASCGRIFVLHDGAMVDIVSATARTILDVRRRTLGYVSQFLRVVPRVSSVDIVAEAAALAGAADPVTQARELLLKFNLPERLHHLAPATFSGGEQQRVNLARGFAGRHPILLLDEPTASLDAANRDRVIAAIKAAKLDGVAMLGIFHDADIRIAVADRCFDMQSPADPL